MSTDQVVNYRYEASITSKSCYNIVVPFYDSRFALVIYEPSAARIFTVILLYRT